MERQLASGSSKPAQSQDNDADDEDLEFDDDEDLDLDVAEGVDEGVDGDSDTKSTGNSTRVPDKNVQTSHPPTFTCHASARAKL